MVEFRGGFRDGIYKTDINASGRVGPRTDIFRNFGYWAADDSRVLISDWSKAEQIENALEEMKVVPGEIVGIWSSQDQTTVVERSYFFYQKETAIRFAKVFGHEKIYDCNISGFISIIDEG